MGPRPVIFVSAVSKELKSARDLVAKTLAGLGYEPKWQDIAPTETGDLRGVLRRWVDDSAAVIQLVGRCHGFEPPEPDALFGRVSYTQYETLYARQRGKQVWYLLLAPGHPTDAAAVEPPELHELQAAYRQRVQSDGHLYHPSASLDQTKIIVLQLRDDLARLRRGWKRWAVAVAAMLVLSLGIGLWLVKSGGEMEKEVIGGRKEVGEVNAKQDQLLQAIRDLPQTLAQGPQGAGKEGEAIRLATVYATLEARLHLPKGTLERELPPFAQQLLARADTSALDKANAEFALKNFPAAEQAALQAKDTATAAAGQPTHDAIAALELAGWSAQKQIQYPRALEHFRAAAALTSRERDPAEWARVQSEIAYLLDDLGRAREAEPILSEVIALRQGVIGSEHPDTLEARNNLALVLDAQGKSTAAEQEHRRVLALRERVLGPEHSDTLESRNNLALSLDSQGKYLEAEQEHRAVLAIREHILGPEHPATLASRNNLANALHSQSKYAAAEQQHRAVLAIRERNLGPKHPDTLSSRMNLANALSSQGKFVAADQEYRAVLALHEDVLGAEHPLTLSSRKNLADELYIQGNFAVAEQEHRAVLAIRERVLGPEHPDTLSSRMSLANVLDAQGNSTEAEEEDRAILATRERVLGSEHPEVFRSCYNLALCLKAQGKRKEAFYFIERAKNGLKQALGTDHPIYTGVLELFEELKENPKP